MKHPRTRAERRAWRKEKRARKERGKRGWNRITYYGEGSTEHVRSGTPPSEPDSTGAGASGEVINPEVVDIPSSGSSSEDGIDSNIAAWVVGQVGSEG